MRTRPSPRSLGAVLVLALAAAPIAAAPGRAHADPPRVVELPEVHIRARGPTVFTTIARARAGDRRDEPRADLVREVPRTVRQRPF